MTRIDRAHGQPGLAGRLSGLLLFVLFLGLGLIGLVLPVIPGLLFLLLALYVLTRQSRRLAGAANRHTGLRQALRRVRQVHNLAPRDRLKLGFWVSARALVNGGSALMRGLGSIASRTRPGAVRHGEH